jgi:carbonic anhydrase/acetyltransferase-like protein (isoleucine patch superfamily)
MSSDAHERAMERSRSFPQSVRAHETAFVAPGAVVVGEVTLGARSSVWFGAVLRGDMDAILLGEESNIQDNSVVHVDTDVPVTIGRRVVIGHRAVIHGATVEDDCLIGMGSILLNRCRIGAGSLVAAGALVAEDKIIPPGSLVVGVPGKVVGQVTPEMKLAMARGAEHYVALAATYRSRGLGLRQAAPGGPILERGSPA